MPELMLDRCKRICNGHSEGCLINSESQLSCVSDMVINHVLGIASVIEMARMEQDSALASEYMAEALGITSDLVNWVRYLQLTRDISKVAGIIERQGCGGHGKRSELRFDMPDKFTRYMSMRITSHGQDIEATIRNFSASGLRFFYGGPQIGSDVLDCVLSMNHIAIEKSVTFRCAPRYVEQAEEGFIVGASVIDVSDSREFDFFRNVFDFMRIASDCPVPQNCLKT